MKQPKSKNSSAEAPYSGEAYLLNDHVHSLFPLSTSAFIVQKFSRELKDKIYKDILSGDESSGQRFLPQQRCYAAKKGFLLRRTVKLDPIAEFFIYDVVYRNRKTFRPDHRSNRRSFGYRFAEGKPQSATEGYGAFKAAIAQARKEYPQTLAVDVATYFNSIYHHDLVYCVRDLGWAEPDVQALGSFLREANVGRSIDCLPHGIHPCKVLGSEFLRFLDNSYKLKSDLLLRFLDDIHLFSSDEEAVISDLLVVQELLGERGLSLNSAKLFEGLSDSDISEDVDSIKASLLQIRRYFIVVSDDVEVEIEEEEEDALSEEQIDYLIALINSPDVEEADAELVLALLRDHGEEVLPRMMDVLRRFPGLTKSVYNYAKFARDVKGLDKLILEFLRCSPLATEYQLFWLEKLAEDFLSKSREYGDILLAAYDHPNSTVISRAKVLEIPDKRFGLPQLREEYLRSGRSDWAAWAAAAGTRKDPAGNRNHVLSYFANGSYLNRFMADCLRTLP